ncbi:MAG: (2Fe-2S)-binding protein [Pseudohongiellaceae bacterium]
MYICICHQITDHQIRTLCRQGASDMAHIRDKLGVASQCGKCGEAAQAIVDECTQSGATCNLPETVYTL